MFAEIFHLLDERGLIRRQIRTFQAMRQFALLVHRLRGTFSDALRVARLAIRAYCSLRNGIAPARRRPEAREIWMAIRQMRCRRLLGLLDCFSGRFLPGKAS